MLQDRNRLRERHLGMLPNSVSALWHSNLRLLSAHTRCISVFMYQELPKMGRLTNLVPHAIHGHSRRTKSEPLAVATTT